MSNLRDIYRVYPMEGCGFTFLNVFSPYASLLLTNKLHNAKGIRKVSKVTTSEKYKISLFEASCDKEPWWTCTLKPQQHSDSTAS